ncbi:autotransporter outer membrane beta-barrel domain-containing protein [Campylobacter sp. US33a]|uniref:autotransporter family protein n=1 Tax=Campylobacter sp. US33a TaxID=2498120 RepID=UPI001068495C|nr:autotransporter outer membrane beta-barrel domain-containing protein [Campylobacter sp. US33a]TEY01207.1 autotransporter outer membrane beta-barrel domain-containing protein [Campylobacter sp. US33a]
MIQNDGTIKLSSHTFLKNHDDGVINSFVNNGKIEHISNGRSYALDNDGEIKEIINNGEIIYSNSFSSVSMIQNQNGHIGKIINNGTLQTDAPFTNFGNIDFIINNGIINATGTSNELGFFSTFINVYGEPIDNFFNSKEGKINLKNMNFISYSGKMESFVNEGQIDIDYSEITSINDGSSTAISFSGAKEFYNNGSINVVTSKNIDNEFGVINIDSIATFTNDINGIISIDKGIAVYASDITTFTNSGIISTNEGEAVKIKNIDTFTNTGTIKSDNGYAITVAAGANIDNQGVLQGSIVALHLHGDGSSSTTPFTTEFSNTGELKFSADKNTGEGAHLGIASYGTLNVNKYKLSITQSAEDFNNANNNNYNIDNNKLNDLDNTDKQSHIIVLGPDAAGGHPDAGWSSINFKEGSVFLDMDSMIKQESSFRLNTVYDSNSLVLANQKDNTTNNFGKLEAVGGEVNNGKGIGSVDFIYLDNNIYKAEYIKGDNAASADLESDYNAKFKITADTLNSKSYVAAQASTLSHIRRNYMIANVIDEEIKNFNQDYKSFIKTYYVDDNYDLANNNGSLKGDGYGLILGLNKRIAEDKILGFYMGYEDLSLDNTMNRLNIKDKAFYGGVNYYLSLMQGEDGDLFAKTQARLSYTDSKMQRTLISSQDNSNYDTLSYGVAFSLGYEKKINNFILTPKMSLAYDRLNIDSFTLGNERYSKNNINLYTLSPALEARYDFNDKMYIAANLGVNINLDDTYNSDFMIENIRYSDSYVLDDFYYFNKIDLGLRLSNNTDIALGYNGIYSNRLTSHSAMFNMRWWF